MLFNIHICKQLNSFCQMTGGFEYELAATVEAHSLENAFMKAQNDMNEVYARNGYRSCSVGDIIESLEHNQDFMVMGVGFVKIDSGVKEFKPLADSIKTV